MFLNDIRSCLLLVCMGSLFTIGGAISCNYCNLKDYGKGEYLQMCPYYSSNKQANADRITSKQCPTNFKCITYKYRGDEEDGSKYQTIIFDCVYYNQTCENLKLDLKLNNQMLISCQICGQHDCNKPNASMVDTLSDLESPSDFPDPPGSGTKLSSTLWFFLCIPAMCQYFVVSFYYCGVLYILNLSGPVASMHCYI